MNHPRHLPTATLGLLETDKLEPDLIDEYGSYGRMFSRYFDTLDGQLNYRYYRVEDGELPRHVGECDAYLITGSRAGVYDALPWLAPLANWIVDFHARSAKIIGICFGHQMIAHSLGGQAARSAHGWGLGVHDTTIAVKGLEQGTRWHAGDAGDRGAVLRLIHCHQDQVERLPPNAQLLAGSDFCRYAAYAIDDRVLSIQGHPEFTPDYFRRLFVSRADDLPPGQLDTALASLATATDHERVGRWLLGFIRNAGSRA